MALLCHTNFATLSGVGIQETVPIKGDRNAEGTIQLRLDPQHGALQRDLWSRALRRIGREPNDKEQDGARLNRPTQPEMQAAWTEVVEHSVDREVFAGCVRTPRHYWKWQFDPQRTTSLYNMGGRLISHGGVQGGHH